MDTITWQVTNIGAVRTADVMKLLDNLLHECDSMYDTAYSRLYQMAQEKLDYDYTPWVAVDGRSLPKWFAHRYYQRFDTNLPQCIKSELGGKLGKLRINARYELTLSNCVDWTEGDFGDDGSCYWSSRSDARPLIKHAGGGSIRVWKITDDGSRVSCSRCWVSPVPHGGLCIWNAYGDLELRQFAGHLAEKLGVTYRDIKLSNMGDGHGTVWVNDYNGFVIAPDVDVYGNEIDLQIKLLGVSRCYKCNNDAVTVSMTRVSGHDICPTCISEASLNICAECGETYLSDMGFSDEYCSHDCAVSSGNYFRCTNCYTTKPKHLKSIRAHTCTSCFNEYFFQCPTCHETHHKRTAFIVQGIHYCSYQCRENAGWYGCYGCGKLQTQSDLHQGPDGEMYCESCRTHA